MGALAGWRTWQGGIYSRRVVNLGAGMMGSARPWLMIRQKPFKLEGHLWLGSDHTKLLINLSTSTNDLHVKLIVQCKGRERCRGDVVRREGVVLGNTSSQPQNQRRNNVILARIPFIANT